MELQPEMSAASSSTVSMEACMPSAMMHKGPEQQAGLGTDQQGIAEQHKQIPAHPPGQEKHFLSSAVRAHMAKLKQLEKDLELKKRELSKERGIFEQKEAEYNEQMKKVEKLMAEVDSLEYTISGVSPEVWLMVDREIEASEREQGPN